jgi:DnaJ-class molecular chaperone
MKTIPNLGMVQKNMTGNLKIIFKIDYPQKLTSEQITALSSIL